MTTQDTLTAPTDAPSSFTPDRTDPVLGLVERDGSPKSHGKAKGGEDIPPAQQLLDDALDFFAEEKDQELGVRTLTIDVGSDDVPRFINITLRGLLDKEQKRLTVQVANDRAIKRIKDETEQNIARQTELTVRTVAAALVSPSHEELAAKTDNPDIPLILKRKFGHKPMLFTTLVSIVYDLSGASEDAVRTAEEPGNGETA